MSLISESKYKHYIRTVPDYPIKGVNFYDMNSLFASDIWKEIVVDIADAVEYQLQYKPTHIVGIESRGFVIGAAVSQVLGVPFVMIRKKGAKYPGSLLKETYDLEYGSDTLVLQEGILGHTSRVLLADDLIATGGSAIASKKLCEQTGANVLGIIALINLKYLNTPEFENLDVVYGEEVTE
jgi:adenine phosphoribosyltransferase